MKLYPADFVSILDVNLLRPLPLPEIGRWQSVAEIRFAFFGKPVGFKTASETFYTW